MRENKFVQVYVTIGKENNETQYLFTVHNHPKRPKKYFDPIHIGTLTIDLKNHFKLRTATEWKTDPRRQEMDERLVPLFVSSINSCLTELLTYDIPELSFLAGKLQYEEISRIAMDWNKSPSTMKILNILFPDAKGIGVPTIKEAKYILQIVEEPIPITDNLFLRSIMPISEMNSTPADSEYYFMGDDIRQLKKYLWWEIVLPEPISYEEFEEELEGEIKGLIYRKDKKLIYTNPIDNAEDLPFQLWLYIKKRYNILPSFYDEESFETARLLNTIRGNYNSTQIK